MQVRKQEYGSATVYDLAAKRVVPGDGNALQLRKQKKTYDMMSRIEIIQDFNFPVACQKIKTSVDGNYLVGAGVYKPQLRYYDLYNMSLKHSQITDYQTVDFELVQDDWRKVITLYRDRYVDFHVNTQSKLRLRTPREGRCIKLNRHAANLYVGGTSSSLYGIDLARGSFSAEIDLDSAGVNQIAVGTENTPAMPLLTAAADDGLLSCIDTRINKVVTQLEVGADATTAFNLKTIPGCTSVAHHPTKNIMAVGTASGHLMLYDLRRRAPLATIDHKSSAPIHTIAFRESSGRTLCIAGDRHAVRLWNVGEQTAVPKLHTAIVPSGTTINSFEIYRDTGMIFTPMDREDIGVYYIPDLGRVPDWCTSLDSTLADFDRVDGRETIYSNHTFVTRENLEKLGLSGIIGSEYLKPAMHGFFVETKVYKAALSVAHPLTAESRAQAAKERREKGRERGPIAAPEVRKKKGETDEDVAARTDRMRELLAEFDDEEEEMEETAAGGIRRGAGGLDEEEEEYESDEEEEM